MNKPLQPETEAWCAELRKKFIFESHHLRLLQIVGQSWDRAAQAAEILAKDGLCTVDKHGGVKPHPACAIERDALNQFMRAVRELGLDLEEGSQTKNRPPAIRPAWSRARG